MRGMALSGGIDWTDGKAAACRWYGRTDAEPCCLPPIVHPETINALQAFRKRNADAKAAHAQAKDQKTDVGAHDMQWTIHDIHMTHADRCLALTAVLALPRLVPSNLPLHCPANQSVAAFAASARKPQHDHTKRTATTD